MANEPDMSGSCSLANHDHSSCQQQPALPGAQHEQHAGHPNMPVQAFASGLHGQCSVTRKDFANMTRTQATMPEAPEASSVTLSQHTSQVLQVLEPASLAVMHAQTVQNSSTAPCLFVMVTGRGTQILRQETM